MNTKICAMLSDFDNEHCWNKILQVLNKYINFDNLIVPFGDEGPKGAMRDAKLPQSKYLPDSRLFTKYI